MTLKQISGLQPVNRASQHALACACSIETPCIEPDVSTMKIISRGMRAVVSHLVACRAARP